MKCSIVILLLDGAPRQPVFFSGERVPCSPNRHARNFAMRVNARSYDERIDNARTTSLRSDRLRISLARELAQVAPIEKRLLLSAADNGRWRPHASASHADHMLSNDCKVCLTDQLAVRFEQVLLREELDACAHRCQMIEIHFIDRIVC